MRIDRVFRVCYTGYPDRAERLREATSAYLAPLGAPAETVWQFPSPWERWILDRAPHIPFLDSHPGCFGAGIGHYRAIKTAYELGSQGVLVMEDDCRFRKGLDLALALAKAPADATCLMLDHFTDRDALGGVEGGWQRVRRAYSSACYALSRAGMRQLIGAHEAPTVRREGPGVALVRTCDNYTNEEWMGHDARIYVAVPNLAVQCLCPGESNCGRKHCIGKYERMGVNLGDFDTF